MTRIQPVFDGNQLEAPAPSATRRVVEDYAAWEAEVLPVFVEAAKTGRPFLCWRVAQANDLPDPPNQQRDWARLMGRLHRDHIVRCDGFGLARDKSAVRRWKGTRAAIEGRES